MSRWRSVYTCVRTLLALGVFLSAAFSGAQASAATIDVPAGGSLQEAIDAAQPGDTILLAPGATYVGNFTLPVHAGTDYITIRSAASDALLPPPGVRVTPAYAAYLPKIRSSNSEPAISTAAGAAYWRLMDLELQANANGYGDILTLGDGSSAQNDLSLLPHHLVVDRVYIHGDPIDGQKRGIGLNSGRATIIDSYVADIKAIGQDSQAIGGWNGLGPYLISNNYLEAAGEVVLFGGDDPKIAGLTPTGIVIRDNIIRRPESWKDPIVPTPANVRPTASTGLLPAGTYGYRVMARQKVSTTTAKSLPSAEVTATVGAGSSVSLSWDPVPNAADYVVFGRTPGGETAYWIVTAPAFVDDGTSGGTAGVPSSTATMWQVKNLLELKNAQQVQIDHNVLENNWAQSQDGMAVLFTPRNQYGGCTWCVVQQVTFEHNELRHSVGAITVLGYDNEHPSQQTNGITIRNNELSDLSKTWGGSGYPFLLLAGPRDVVIDHNTVISTGKGFLEVSGAPVSGFTMTNNVGRHNTYGIFGSNYGYGTTAIVHYFPDGVITDNVLAGGSAKSYPSGNLFPTTASFEAHFADYANGVYALTPGTDWAGAGTDGLDLGAAEPVFDGVAAAFSTVQLTTSALPSTIEGNPYSTTLSAAGGLQPYAWSIGAGGLPEGLTLDPVSGLVSGAATLAGDYTFTASVTDATGTTSAQPLVIHVDPLIPPVQILSGALPAAVATVPYTQALTAAGGTGSYTWALSGGALPVGMSLAANGVLSGVPSLAGTFAFTAIVADAADATRTAPGTFALVVEPPPNVPPSVSLSGPVDGSTMPVGATVNVSAQATDVDGTVQRVDFFANGALIGSSAGPAFATTWSVPAPGTYAFSAIAVDDRGASTASGTATVATSSEVVLYASQVGTMVGNYALAAATDAAGGYVLANHDYNTAKVQSPAASPASYAEFSFYAEAGRPYHLWIRGYAHANDPYNDSAYVQFDGVADARIGSTSARTVNLEDCGGCGLSGWGWQDDGWGTGVLGAPIYFERTGLQTLRIQPREDGFNIDQIVLSPETYVMTAPGALKNDTTILASAGSAAVEGGSSDASASSTPPALATWTSADVGATSPAGSASLDAATGIAVVAGAGDDIWGTADAFQFFYQPLTGDGEIVAHVASVQNIRSWTKAGVMIRDTLDPSSAQAMMVVSAAKGTAFQRRVSAGGLSTNTAGPFAGAPYWVRLVRAGSTFTAYASVDGATWTTVGSETIAMGTTIDVGLVVSSHENGVLATATFDHVTVTKR
ncbi:MAG TPA: putative Ig domain-containing protein [Vicinamibacterales bacterium]|nr:putative Ig domain-containing protein [Vicinamibacterales bacterium]